MRALIKRAIIFAALGFIAFSCVSNWRNKTSINVNNKDFSIGNDLCAKGDYKGAEPLLLKAIDELRTKNSTLKIAKVEMALGRVYTETQRYSEAYTALNNSYSTFKRVLGEKNQNTKSAKYNLGVYFYLVADYENADKIFTELLAIGSSPLNEMRNYCDMYVRTLMRMGSYKAALRFYRSQDEYYKKSEQTNSKEYMQVLNSSALIFIELGQYKDGIDYLEQAVAVHNDYTDAEDSALATYYSNLAQAYSFVDDKEKVFLYNEKALRIYIKISGENSFDVARMYRFMGACCEQIQQIEKALDYYTKALDIAIGTVGENNDFVALTYSNFSSYYSSIGDYESAIRYAEKAVDIRKNILGAKSASAAGSYLTLAGCYRLAGQYEKSIEAGSKAGEIFIETYGVENVNTVDAFFVLSKSYLLAGNEEKAINLASNGTGIINKLFNSNCTLKANAYQNEGYIYSQIGDTEKALKYYKGSHDVYLRAYDDKYHTAISEVAASLGDLYSNQNDYENALHYYNEALDIELKVSPEEVGYCEETYHSIGFVQYKMGKYDDALENYKNSIELREKQIAKCEKIPNINLEPQYIGLSNTLNNIAAVYEDTGKIAEAVAYERRAYRMLVDHDIAPEADDKMMQRLHRLYALASPRISYEQWILQ
ncbi:MAG: tetratricopeptide repeat protein [Oscillospiraceae bacterium]|jgi:tetratricopeptide (TPR) repeat protein|nr:tetratricopeptide repeat protein [Oscillospiraceae bacterium]